MAQKGACAAVECFDGYGNLRLVHTFPKPVQHGDTSLFPFRGGHEASQANAQDFSLMQPFQHLVGLAFDDVSDHVPVGAKGSLVVLVVYRLPPPVQHL